MSKFINILILEDNEDDAILLIRQIKKAGYKPNYKMVCSPKPFREKLKELNWDLILSDYSMPDFTAMDALEILKEENLETPFIIVSGAIGEETAVSAMKAGAHDFIKKGSVNRLIPSIERELKEIERKQQIKNAQETIKQNEVRFKALYKLSQMDDSTREEIASFVINEAINLTKSKIGYIGFLSNDNIIINKNAIIINDSNIELNHDFDEKSNLRVPIKSCNIWLDIIKGQNQVIYNKTSSINIKENCFIFDKIKIKRYIGIPILDNNEPKLLAIVGNKKTDYNKRDTEQLQLLLKGMYQNIQKKENQEKIKKSLQEKDILLREIHHRVKNNLQVISSLLNLQSKSIDNEKYLNIFKESQNRIRTMALVHEKLYQSENLGHINLSEYLYNVAVNLFHSYNSLSHNIKLESDIQDISMDIELAIPCGLIVNELISNSIKYAFPEDKKGNIFLKAVLLNNSTYNIIVEDNGIGFSNTDNNYESDSLGLQLVKALVNQIDGELNINTDNGTKFEIKFKKLNKN